MSVHTAGIARVATLGLIWGSSFLWIKVGLGAFSPLQLVLVRLTLGALVLAVVVVIQRAQWPAGRTIWRHLAVASIFGNVIPYTLFGVAEQQISSAAAGILNGTTPLWTIVLALVVRHEGFRLARLIGLVLGFLGVTVVFGPWNVGDNLATGGGLACLAAAFSYGISYIYMSRFLAHTGHSTASMAASQLGIGAAITAVVILIFDRSVPTLDIVAIAGAVVLGAVCTGLAYLLNYRIIRDDGATTASVVTYLLPIVAVLLGVVALDEQITLQALAGTAIILSGVVITRRYQAPKPTPNQPTHAHR